MKVLSLEEILEDINKSLERADLVMYYADNQQPGSFTVNIDTKSTGDRINAINLGSYDELKGTVVKYANYVIWGMLYEESLEIGVFEGISVEVTSSEFNALLNSRLQNWIGVNAFDTTEDGISDHKLVALEDVINNIDEMYLYYTNNK